MSSLIETTIYTQEEWRAIGWFQRRNRLKALRANPPILCFRLPTGARVNIAVSIVLERYRDHLYWDGVIQRALGVSV